MNNKFLKSIVAGIIATIAMTVLMVISGKLGMPKMEPPHMLATTLGAPVVVGWMMHFMIGVSFALIYTYVISGWFEKINSVVLKGVVFGVIAAVMAKVSMTIMGKMFDTMPAPSGNMALVLMGLVMGHILFGIVVVWFIHRK
ncbi:MULTISPECIES: DUF6789 family protein [Olleya]|uniref:Uncharacterized protein n=1 Tax=Olleya namhaensis TaxID=1144750 RepID=A0A1I3QDF8_9FLAO|nr:MULTISPECIES: DUF6789 family protein [Olleya]PKG52303.1 hypothetical protein CXF54_04340 [Olleya sp. 1-3]SFJ31619.1 hypothetical protein SAMN05443431_10678 [Olleya namhaensis]